MRDINSCHLKTGLGDDFHPAFRFRKLQCFLKKGGGTHRRNANISFRRLVAIPKVRLAFEREPQPRAAVIDGRNEVLRGPEPERAMADRFDLVVHSLHSAVRDTVIGPAQNPFEMST